MELRNLSDSELVERFLEGDQSGIEILIHRYKNRIYTYILLIVKNQHLAEDIFQDTFVKVINSLKSNKYKENGRFLSWVIRIAHNLIIDHFRKEKQLNVTSSDPQEYSLSNNRKHSAGTIEEELVSRQITSEVRQLIQYLPPDQREVVLLRHYTGLSFKEIADITNVSINTALGRMRYALINLRKLIRENNLSLTMS